MRLFKAHIQHVVSFVHPGLDIMFDMMLCYAFIPTLIIEKWLHVMMICWYFAIMYCTSM